MQYHFTDPLQGMSMPARHNKYTKESNSIINRWLKVYLLQQIILACKKNQQCL